MFGFAAKSNVRSDLSRGNPTAWMRRAAGRRLH